MNVGVIGLGKLGLPLACVLADRGHHVRAWDISADVRDAYKRREAHVDEPDVQRMLSQYGKNNLGLDTPVGLGEHCDAVFIVVPTPSNEDGSFDDTHVVAAIEDMLPGITHRERDRTPLLIMLVSTVSPGTCEQLAALLPPYPGYKAHLVYSPVFIALGSVVADLTHPQLRVMGLPFEIAASTERLLDHLVWGGAEEYMTYREAEIAKIAFNVFTTLKITFANGIGQLCHLHGANADTVLGSIVHDDRVGGKKMLTAGGGYGGPCLPRDNRALEHALTGVVSLSSYIDWLNNEHADFIIDIGLNVAGTQQPGKFMVLGAGYKEGVDDGTESFGLRLHDKLIDRGWKVGYMDDANLIILALPMRELKLDADKLMRDAVVVDVWRTHSYLRNGRVRYIPFGGTT